MFTNGWSLDYEATNMNLRYLDCNKVSIIFSLAYFLRHVIIRTRFKILELVRNDRK